MVIISPPIFDLLFYAIVLLFGLDFLISGVLILLEHSANSKKSRFVGLWIIRKMSALYDSTTPSKFFSLIFSTRNMAIQAVFAAVLLIIGSLIMIVDVGLRLF